MDGWKQEEQKKSHLEDMDEMRFTCLIEMCALLSVETQ